MPLFTYVVSYKSIQCLAQGRHSNYQGFYHTWLGPFPKNELARLGGRAEKELWQSGLVAQFQPVSNMKNAWVTAFPLGDGTVHVVAVRTEG